MAEKKSKDITDFEVRLTIAEVKMNTIDDFIQEQKDNFKELTASVNYVKERLDKTHNDLPHLVSSMNKMVKELSNVSEKINAHEKKLAVGGAYGKIVWGIVALISTVVGGVLIEMIVKK